VFKILQKKYIRTKIKKTIRMEFTPGLELESSLSVWVQGLVLLATGQFCNFVTGVHMVHLW
jgi:hypothetical protein